MQFGYNENKLRTKPTFSGQKAICPLCEGVLIGKCGEIYTWHWQHHQDRECDPWKEHETVWHRKWKANFPDNWQEVIIERFGEKHIADVKTKNGFVIEFQNSSISTSTIRIREEFYEEMIWVVNAKSFKHNFQLRSVVSARLRMAESNASNELSSIIVEYDRDLKCIQKDIDENVKLTANSDISIENKKQTIEKLNDLLDDFDNFSETVLNMWSTDRYYWNYSASKILSKIESEIKNKLKEISKSIQVHKGEIDSKKQRLKFIEAFEDFKIDETVFKIVDYEQISPTNYFNARAILKRSRTTLFPEITTFSTEVQFQMYKYKKGEFDFVIDLTETVSSLILNIKEQEEAIVLLENLLPSIKGKLRDILLTELKDEIQVVQNEMANLENERQELVKQNYRLNKRKTGVHEEKIREISKSTVEIEKKKRDQRFKIMKEKKGLYTFEWKHERKSWNAASSKIYFDIGEDYLFEKVSDSIFKKTMIHDFLATYLLDKTEEQ